jgi:hypothetical protein
MLIGIKPLLLWQEANKELKRKGGMEIKLHILELSTF